MKTQIKMLLAQKGYPPVFEFIKKSYSDLQQVGETKKDAKDFLADLCNIGDEKINLFIRSL